MEAALQKMFFWQRTSFDLLVAVAVVGVVSPVLLVGEWPFRVGSSCLAFAWIALWTHLFRSARIAGGLGYAIGHLLLSIVLTPLFLLGVLLVPQLVESDARKGSAAWMRDRARTVPERVMGSISGIVAFCLGGAAGVLVGGLWGVVVGAAVALAALRLLTRIARPNSSAGVAAN